MGRENRPWPRWLIILCNFLNNLLCIQCFFSVTAFCPYWLVVYLLLVYKHNLEWIMFDKAVSNSCNCSWREKINTAIRGAVVNERMLGWDDLFKILQPLIMYILHERKYILLQFYYLQNNCFHRTWAWSSLWYSAVISVKIITKVILKSKIKIQPFLSKAMYDWLTDTPSEWQNEILWTWT